LRWPDGVVCPRCEGTKISRIGWKPGGRYQYDCGSCRYRFSPTVGTIFHDSHLPLWKWFAAVYLMIESKKGVSANQLKRTLRVADKTAWFLTHRIRAAMREDVPEMLLGIVEVDETYVGGKKQGKRRGAGQGSKKGKTMVVGAIERSGNVRLRMDRRSPSAAVLESFIKTAVSEGAEHIYTDGSTAYKGLAKRDPRHDSVDHSAEEWVRGDVHTNSVENAWSLLKRSIVGSYHKLSVKHLPAYLDEFTFRFNGRKNPYLFRDTLLRLIGEDPLTYRELTAQTD
jgi:transposase-like protein